MKTLYNNAQITKEQIENAIEDLAEKINIAYNSNNLRKQPVIILCVLKGAFIFTADLVRKLNFPCQIEFIQLSSYESDTSTGKVSMIGSLPNLNHRDIIIVEDIVDTGLSLDYLLDCIYKEFKYLNSIISIALLYKNKNRKIKIRPDYFCFEIEDEFVVGYGLDYDEKYRNLNYIGLLE